MAPDPDDPPEHEPVPAIAPSPEPPDLGPEAALTETAPDLAAGNVPAAPSPLKVGGNLKHYEIIRKLGEGGMGTVFLARDTKLGRLVAIKILLKLGGSRAGRFLAEARATARCKHEHIVVIYEVDETSGFPYMVLEYLEGRTLREWMAQRKPTGMGDTPGRDTALGPVPTG